MMQPQVGYATKSGVLLIAYLLSKSGSAHIGWYHAAQAHALFAYCHSCIFPNLKACFCQTNFTTNGKGCPPRTHRPSQAVRTAS